MNNLMMVSYRNGSGDVFNIVGWVYEGPDYSVLVATTLQSKAEPGQWQTEQAQMKTIHAWQLLALTPLEATHGAPEGVPVH